MIEDFGGYYIYGGIVVVVVLHGVLCIFYLVPTAPSEEAEGEKKKLTQD